MSYRVYDNGKPADSTHHNLTRGIGWDCADFETLTEAQNYADNWLGNYATPLTFDLQPGKPIDYSGYGDYIEIREVTKV